MRKPGLSLVRVVGSFLVASSVALPQRGAGDWMTSGFDAQRSFWIRTDAKIAKDRLVKEGFQFLWKSGSEKNANRQAAVTAPLSLGYYIGYRGFRSFVFASGGDNVVFAIDSDLQRLEWEKRLDAAPPSSASAPCATGFAPSLTRPTVSTFPVTPAGTGGAGRASAAKSAVGAPNEGAALLAEIAARAAAAARAPRRPNPAPVNTPTVGLVHAIASDGKLHSMYLSNGDEPQPAVTFLAPYAKVHGFTVTGGFAYAAAAPNCGDAAKSVWALDLASKQVTSWEAPGGIAGSAGPAFGPDTTLYITTADGQLVALEAKTLRHKGAYRSGTAGFATSPVVFEYKGKTVVAAMAKDGSIQLVDPVAIKTSLAKTASGVTGSMPSALASWRDSAGTRWILVATGSAIAAWKVVEQNGALSLVRGWISREIDSPMTPMIVNGVVFAVSSGARSSHAVLYAFDGTSGKELWNSGTTIATSIPPNGGLSTGNSQIYVGGADGNIYTFGFPMEH